MITEPCVIILDRAKPAEREAVHEAIKENADTWWHQFTNVWIAGGHRVSFWTDLIRPLLPDGPSGLIVLHLPEDEKDRLYSAYMRNVDNRTKWLDENYTSMRSITRE